MRPDRLLRFVGLALVLLFPLLSVLQLRDTDRPWRDAARQVRPSILGMYRESAAQEPPAYVSCGLILQVSPARVVVPGVVETALTSLHGGRKLHWRPLLSDVQGQFTVLEADRVASDSAALEALRSPAKLLLDPSGNPQADVEVALVPPLELGEQPLWVGVLSVGLGQAGRPGYYSSFLTPINASGPEATVTASAGETVSMNPQLRGAPFVGADGTVVAFLLDRGAQGVHALPLEVVAQALALQHLQAAQ